MKKWMMILAASVGLWALQARAESAQVALTTTVQNEEKEVLLADIYNRTLYVFDLDQNTNTSKCVGDCAEVWPPYMVTDAEAKVLTAPLGTVQRANKKLQLTYNGRPLYTYAFDRKQGDDQGDGLGDVWHYLQLK